MGRVTAIRIAVLYLPLAAAVLALVLRRRRKRVFVACLLSLLWTLPTLLIVQRINLVYDWWTFPPAKAALVGMPLEFYLGWAVLWGLFPQLALLELDLPEVMVLMASADLWLMPMCRPLINLRGNWLLGDGVALVLVLAPAFCLARWTVNDTHLSWRATMQVALAGLLFLFFLPEVVFALRPAANASSVWEPMFGVGSFFRQVTTQLIFLLAVPGVSAVQEFSERGDGTPIPYDPPRKMVTSGIYRYCSNPMQFSCSVVMLVLAMLLRSPWYALAAAVATVYSVGIAHWDEGHDLAARFGERWRHYRDEVPAWRLRWRPYHEGPPARLYVARTCGGCNEIREWIESCHPIGLELIEAETLPEGSIRRLRYDPSDGTEAVEGVAAFARTLEHLNLAWAYCGMTLRLPGIRQVFQLLMDASGLGPRRIAGSCPHSTK